MRRVTTSWKRRGTPGRTQAPGATGAEVPPTGTSLDFPFVGVFRVENGKVNSIRIYFDQIEVFVQLGLMPQATSS